MAESIRSGRVSIPAAGTRLIITGSLTGSAIAMYRLINSGKAGDKVEVLENGTKIAELAWGDSIDIGVKQKKIEVKAPAGAAAVVYDFLGLA